MRAISARLHVSHCEIIVCDSFGIVICVCVLTLKGTQCRNVDVCRCRRGFCHKSRHARAKLASAHISLECHPCMFVFGPYFNSICSAQTIHTNFPAQVDSHTCEIPNSPRTTQRHAQRGFYLVVPLSCATKGSCELRIRHACLRMLGLRLSGRLGASQMVRPPTLNGIFHLNC